MFAAARLSDEGLEKFSLTIKKHCDSVGYHDLQLSENELQQLSWYLSSTVVAPTILPSAMNQSLHPEIMRGLARRYSFELLLRGDLKAYNEFVKGQETAPLSLKAFDTLAKEAQVLPADVKTVVRASCLLTITPKAKEVLTSQQLPFPADSEQFLTALADHLVKNKKLLPLTEDFTPAQLSLLPKMYWANTHFHHLMYIEGGVNMTKSLIAGITSENADKRFTLDDFTVWKWRWLCNLFGLKGAPAAKYYNAEVHLFAMTVVSHLQCLFFDVKHDFLKHYSARRAEFAGFTSENLSPFLANEEIAFLTHLASYSNEVNVASPMLGQEILLGYQNFQREFEDRGELADGYQEKSSDALAITPTHTPAILNNSFAIFKNTYNISTEESLRLAAQFACQVFSALYALSHDRLISCRTLAAPQKLQAIIAEWRENPKAFAFAVNEEGEMVERKVEVKLTDSPRMTK